MLKKNSCGGGRNEQSDRVVEGDEETQDGPEVMSDVSLLCTFVYKE